MLDPQKILADVWDSGYNIHKQTVVKGNIIDEREFRKKSSDEAEVLLRKFYAEEMLSVLPKKKLPAYRQGRNLPPEIVGSETTDYPRIKALKSHNQGYNQAIAELCTAITERFLG